MKISESELKILESLWTQSPLTVGQIIQRIQKHTDWHENTIKTLLTRLMKKKAVCRYKDGKRFFYSAKVERDIIVSQETENFLSKFFGGNMAPFVAHFNKTKKLSEEEITQLEVIIEELRNNNE